MYPNLPNLFVIGAAKSGTTTLYSILARHPEVFMSQPKATRFFVKDKFYKNGLAWYLQTFFDGAERYSVRGEATPSYLANAEITAPRIKNTVPDNNIKFIAIFRNPVERAYSHYWYNRDTKKDFQEASSFEEALIQEQQRAAGNNTATTGHTHIRDYFKNGNYADYLKEYFKFFDREQFLLLLTEDLYKEYFQATSTKIANFMNIGDAPTSYTKENQSRKVGSRPSVKFVRKQRGFMSLLKAILPSSIQDLLRNRYAKMISQPVKYHPITSETKIKLLERYKPGIMELQNVMNRDLSHWMQDE
jgi:hypothetical protein